MGRKSILSPIFIAQAQSLAADFNTNSTNVQFQDSIAYQINVTTSDSTGTFYLQASADNSNWVDIGQAGTVGAANTIILCEFDLSRTAPYVRLRYAHTISGTGVCDILLTAKPVGD